MGCHPRLGVRGLQRHQRPARRHVVPLTVGVARHPAVAARWPRFERRQQRRRRSHPPRATPHAGAVRHVVEHAQPHVTWRGRARVARATSRAAPASTPLPAPRGARVATPARATAAIGHHARVIALATSRPANRCPVPASRSASRAGTVRNLRTRAMVVPTPMVTPAIGKPASTAPHAAPLHPLIRSGASAPGMALGQRCRRRPVAASLPAPLGQRCTHAVMGDDRWFVPAPVPGRGQPPHQVDVFAVAQRGVEPAHGSHHRRATHDHRRGDEADPAWWARRARERDRDRVANADVRTRRAGPVARSAGECAVPPAPRVDRRSGQRVRRALPRRRRRRCRRRPRARCRPARARRSVHHPGRRCVPRRSTSTSPPGGSQRRIAGIVDDDRAASLRRNSGGSPRAGTTTVMFDHASTVGGGSDRMQRTGIDQPIGESLVPVGQ